MSITVIIGMMLATALIVRDDMDIIVICALALAIVMLV